MAGAHVRVWWRVDSRAATRNHAEAVALERELEHTIWPKLTALMGSPVSDAGESCNGGDGRLDFWLTRQGPGTKAETFPYVGLLKYLGSRPCPAVPVYIELDPGRATRQTAAHELMHALQIAFPKPDECYTYSWLDEATAKWAEDYVYPRDDGEHAYKHGLAFPWLPLNHPLYSRDEWTFFYYLTKTQRGGPRLIRNIFEQARSKGSEQAVDAAVPGGFARRLPEYGVYTWNQPPIGPSFAPARSSFAQWDRFPVVPREGKNKPIRTRPVKLNQEMQLDSSVLYELSRRYFRFSFPDSRVRKVVLNNGWSGLPGGSLQAIINIAGRWQLQDWSQRSTITLCRDKPSENVRGLILVLTDTSLAGTLTPSNKPKIRGESNCYPVYYKILNVSFSTHASGTKTGPASLCDQSGTRDFSGTMTTQPTPYPSKLDRNPSSGQLSGAIDGDTAATWTNQHETGCKVTDTGLQPCSVDSPDARPSDGKWQIGFAIDVQSPSPTLKVHWYGPPDPSIGYVSGGDPSQWCNVYIFEPLAYEDSAATVSMADLLSGAPVTKTFSGSKHLTSNDPGGGQSAIDYSWTLSVTFQVAAAGDPNIPH